MTYLSQYTSIIVLNIFTKADTPPYTLSARSFLRQCGYSDALLLYKDRLIEDSSALKGIATQIIYLPFIDALWRKKTFNKKFPLLHSLVPEYFHLYPTYRFHILKGKIAAEDYLIYKQIKMELLSKIKEGVVFCPLGIGNHVDHVIVNKLSEELKRPIIYWTDFPYSQNTQANRKDFTISFSFDQCKHEKLTILRKYKTQFSGLFSSLKPSLKEEKFFTNINF
jgi:hypothetical protein